MKKCLLTMLVAVSLFTWFLTPAIADDIELAKKSTLEKILQRGELRIGFESGYMPFEMTDKNGKYVGFDLDLGKALAKSMGVKLVVVNTDWDGIIPALLTDKFDIILGGMTVNPERNLKINFSNPYIVVGQTILVNKKHEGTVKSFRDLNNPKYIVASRLGTTGDEAIKKYMPKAQYKSYDSQAEAAMEVVQGKADAMVYDLPFCAVFNSQQGAGKLLFLDKPFTYEPLAIGVRKGDPDFLNFLNNFLNLYKNDGRYERAYNKWIASNDWYSNIAN